MKLVDGAVLGELNFEDVKQFSERSQYRQFGKSIGLFVDENNNSICTSWLVSKQYILLPNYCIQREDDSRNTVRGSILFNFLGEVSKKESIKFGLEKDIVEINSELGFAILKIRDNENTDDLIPLPISGRNPNEGEELFILHYPEGLPLVVSRVSCRTVSLTKSQLSMFGHSCDTKPGSSGAPVFSARENVVIGFHSLGSSLDKNSFNQAVLMSAMIRESPILQKIIDQDSNSIVAFTEEPVIKKYLPGRYGSFNLGDPFLINLGDIISEGSERLYERVEDFTSRSNYRRQSASVGRLDVLVYDSESESLHIEICTGWMVTVNHVLTSLSCLFGSQNQIRTIRRVGLQLGYLTVQDSVGKFMEFNPSPVETNPNLNYAILRVSTKDKQYLYQDELLKILPRDIEPNEELYVLHFPKADELVLTRAMCRVEEEDETIPGVYMHQCDSEFTSTGAPIFSLNDNAIVGFLTSPHDLEESSDKKGGRFTSISFVAEQSKLVGNRVRQEHIFKSPVSRPVRSAKFLDNVSKIITIGDNMPFRIWDTITGEIRDLSSIGHAKTVLSMDVDGSIAATGSKNGLIGLWNFDTDERSELSGHNNWVLSVSFSPDGRSLVSTSVDHTARLWNLPQRLTLSEFRKTDDISNNENTNLNPEAGNDVERVLKECQVSNRTLTGHADWVVSAAFSPDGCKIATVSRDESVRLWDVTTGDLLKQITLKTGPLTTVEFNPVGDKLLVGTFDGSVELVDLSNEKSLLKYKAHRSAITDVLFTPDGQFFITASIDGLAKAWSVESNKVLGSFSKHTGPIWSIDIDTEGSAVVTASHDGQSLIWNMDFLFDAFLLQAD